jgi:hypothetical protein
MSRWWMVMAVCGLTVLPSAVPAQPPAGYGAPEAGALPAPSGYGMPAAAPMPPAPAMPYPPAAMPPLGPAGPSDDNPMVLTHLGPTAFEAAGSPPEGWFFNVGSVALQRQRLNSMPIGQADPGVPTTNTATVTVPVTFQNGRTVFTMPANVDVAYTTRRFPDNGVRPPADAPFLGDYHDVDPLMSWGFSGTLGFRYGNSSVELDGFYIPDNGASTVQLSPFNLPVPVPVTVDRILNVTPPPTAPNARVVSVDNAAVVAALAPQTQNQPGQIDLPFFNAPKGFNGDRGLWLQADQATVSFRSTLGNLEANYRYWTSEQFQVLIGLRYIDEREDLRIFTQDDVFSKGFDDPTKDALYQVVTHNRLLLGQLGLQGECPLGKFVGVGGFVKGGWGPNFLISNVLLARGDGLVGFNGTRQATVFGQAYEMGAFLNLYCTEQCRLHAGFNLFWLAGVAEAEKQINYDLSQTTGSVSNNGSIFYYGPTIELQFVF